MTTIEVPESARESEPFGCFAAVCCKPPEAVKTYCAFGDQASTDALPSP